MSPIESSPPVNRWGRFATPVGRTTMGGGVLAAFFGGYAALQELVVGTFFSVGTMALVAEFGIQLVFIGHAIAHRYRLQPRHDESWRRALPKPGRTRRMP